MANSWTWHHNNMGLGRFVQSFHGGGNGEMQRWECRVKHAALGLLKRKQRGWPTCRDHKYVHQLYNLVNYMIRALNILIEYFYRYICHVSHTGIWSLCLCTLCTVKRSSKNKYIWYIFGRDG